MAKKGKSKLAAALSAQQSVQQAKKDAARREAAQEQARARKRASVFSNGARASKKRRVEDDAAQKRATVPFTPGEKVLLVGEGNFSFAASLLGFSPAIVTPSLLWATAYDSEADAAAKYSDLPAHTTALREAGADVLYGVDGTSLMRSSKPLKRTVGERPFDSVVFNFPHTGSGTKDQARNIREHQELMLAFFKSAQEVIRPGKSNTDASASGAGKKNKRRRDEVDDDDQESGGEVEEEELEDEMDIAMRATEQRRRGKIMVTLRTGLPYSLWNLTQLAKASGLRVVRSFAFDPGVYAAHGYEHRRTVGFKDGVSTGENDDLTLTARERGLKKAGALEGDKKTPAAIRTWISERADE